VVKTSGKFKSQGAGHAGEYGMGDVIMKDLTPWL
jgi:hypothetical protein